MSDDMVESPRDLEALPVGTIVWLGPGPADIIVRAAVGFQLGDWLPAGDERPLSVAEIAQYWAEHFPARIRYRPAEADTPTEGE